MSEMSIKQYINQESVKINKKAKIEYIDSRWPDQGSYEKSFDSNKELELFIENYKYTLIYKIISKTLIK